MARKDKKKFQALFASKKTKENEEQEEAVEESNVQKKPDYFVIDINEDGTYGLTAENLEILKQAKTVQEAFETRELTISLKEEEITAREQKADENFALAEEAKANAAADGIAFGESEKQRLINEGNADKERIIADAKETAKSKIDGANAQAEGITAKALKDADEMEKDFNNRVEKQVKKEVDERWKDKKAAADAIKSEADKYAKNKTKLIESREKAVDQRSDELDKNIDDWNAKMESINNKLIEKLQALTNEKIAFDSEKVSIRNAIYAEYEEKIKNLLDEKSKADLDIQKKLDEINAKDAEIKKLNAQLDYLEGDANDVYQQASEAIMTGDSATRTKALCDARIAKADEDYRNLLKENNKLESELRRLGPDPIQWKEDNAKLREENGRLKDQLAALPTPEKYAEYQKIEADYERIKTQLSKTLEDMADAKTRLIQKMGVEHERVALTTTIETLEHQRDELMNELKDLRDQYEQKINNAFPNLSEIDNKKPLEVADKNVPSDLYSLCREFQGEVYNEKEKFIYDIEDVKAFVSFLACSKLIVLEGLSGTGKTSLPKLFSRFIAGKNYIIPVQSSWKDKNDLLGFYNDFKKEYKETEFLTKLYQCKHDEDVVGFMVLDEMNLSRIEYYFADYLAMMENDPKDRKIEVISDALPEKSMPALFEEGKLLTPENAWFIGTANKDDSTQPITDKVYDRAGVIEFTNKGDKANVVRTKNKLGTIAISYTTFNDMITDPSFEYFEDSRAEKVMNKVLEVVEEAFKEFKVAVGYRMLNQLRTYMPVYLASSTEDGPAIFNKVGSEMENYVYEGLDRFLPRKYIRKLENVYGDAAKQPLEDLKNNLILRAGKGNMPKTIRAIDEIIKNC